TSGWKQQDNENENASIYSHLTNPFVKKRRDHFSQINFMEDSSFIINITWFLGTQCPIIPNFP
ncbi:MAG: hypothetical protein ACYSWZ_22465, partial [Planctomycetota bacterium]